MRNRPILPTLIRVVPMAFALGAVMELFMIYGKIGSETFYETAKRLENERIGQQKQAFDQLKQRVEERKENRELKGEDLKEVESS